MPNGSHQTQASPIGQLPAHDYGAETLRNYRYQSAYAIVLLAAAAAKKNDYHAVWCEQTNCYWCSGHPPNALELLGYAGRSVRVLLNHLCVLEWKRVLCKGKEPR